MAILKAGGIATLLNGWWEAGRDGACDRAHRAQADHRRCAAREADRGALRDREIVCHCRSTCRSSRRSRSFLTATRSAALPEVAPEDDATILFTSGSTGESQGRAVDAPRGDDRHLCLCDRPDRPARHAEQEGRAATARRARLLSVPLFHVTGEVPVMLNSFVIGRCMVIMPKWDAGEALRLIEKEKDHLFRRRADDEPRADEPSRPAQIRPVVADRHHRRRRAAARSAMSSGCSRNSPTPSRRSATA